MVNKIPVIMDHDGGVDDFLSLLLLLTMEHVDLKAITITPADCYLENAYPTTCKLLAMAGRENIPIGIGSIYGINAFPPPWRAAPKVLNALPAIINIETPETFENLPTAVDLLCQCIAESNEPITILMTGPCSNLVQALEKQPALKSNIKEVIWMAGAVDVPGNVKMYNSNATQEWNIFWDAPSAAKLLAMKLPLVFIPLDATNAVPVNFDFLKLLARQSHHPLANLAAQFWATTVATIPSYETIYFMWDVLTTSYLAIPGIFTFEELELHIPSSGASAGQTLRQPGNGQWVKVAMHADKQLFYDYIIRQFSNG